MSFIGNSAALSFTPMVTAIRPLAHFNIPSENYLIHFRGKSVIRWIEVKM